MKKEEPRIAFIDYQSASNCKNLEDSYGMICVKCGKCGRKFKNGNMIKKNESEKPYDI
jgi:hypothetical protein